MKPRENPNWFACSPLERLNNEKDLTGFVAERLKDPESLLAPLWRGDPFVVDGKAAFLSAAALSEFPKGAPVVLLGVKNGRAYFAVDASGAAEERSAAPFADIGEYAPIRAAAGVVSRDDAAIIGHARWLFEWHRHHRFCARCGGETVMINGGGKRRCEACGAEHFPRSDPVAIVLAAHEDACLLGRNARFPPGFLSALAGYVEAAETPEECAVREVYEEVGVRLTDVRYQFSQPWPFPSSLMMGFLADAESRDLTLDTDEIEESRWVSIDDVRALLAGEARHGIFLPPKFTIARQLIERWAGEI
ncbi:MAG: NAD(+) diphosphatase [Parvularculaceae bacterium]